MSFDQAFALTVSPSVEGGYTCSAADPGNWTGGRVGAGELQGTQFGISAAFLHALPASDPYAGHAPRLLDLAACRLIYRAHFWNTVEGDALPPPVAGLLFDAAVNQGASWAPCCLQAALGVAVDGAIGPKTLAAAGTVPVTTLHAEIARVRDERYRQSADWSVFGIGWMRRLMTVVAQTHAFT